MRHFRASLYASTVLMLAIASPAVAQTDESSQSPDASGQTKPPVEQEVVVTGYRESLRSARAVKQRSDAILDTVVAEDLGQLPDNSATEALARLPGVQIFRNRGEGQAITIRGLSQTLTTLNGQESYNGSSRRSLLNSYPAGLLRSVTVYKALTPDLIEGGIGGAVNVELRQPFDFRDDLVVAGTVRGSYDDQSRKLFYNGDILVSDRWDTGIGEMGLLLNASYLRRDYFESYRETLSPTNSAASANITPTGLGTVRYPGVILVKQPNGRYERPVLTGSFQWKPASNLRIDLRVTNIDDNNVNYDADVQTAVPTTLTDVALVPGTNVVQSATFATTSASGPRSSRTDNNINTTQAEFAAQYIAGRATLSTQAIYTRSIQDSRSQLFLLAFRNRPTVNAIFQSDSRFGGLSYSYAGNVDITDPANFYVRAYSDTISEADADGLQWRTDLELDTGGGLIKLIKTGFRYASRSTDFQTGTRLANLDALRLPMSDFPGGGSPQIQRRGFYGDDVSVPTGWVQYDTRLLDDPANLNALNAYVATLPGQAALFGTETPALNPLQAFSGTERSYAVYAQTKYGFDLGGDVSVDGIIGARIVNTKLAISGTQVTTTRTTAGTVVTYTPIDGRQNYLDVDPSISAVVHFGRNVQLRAAWTKTFSRPDFSQLNPSLNLAEIIAASGAITSAATAGNPDLQPIRSTNWDASLEWYFGRAGSASIAGFIRDVNGFIVNTREDELLPGSAAGTVSVQRPINAGDGVIKGIELSASTFFDFAPGPLANFGASANLTLIDTNQMLPATPVSTAFEGPITGISKRSFNAAVFYDDGRFRARVAYAIRSRFVLAYVLSDPIGNLNWYPISRLDASMAYKVTDNVTLTLDGQNLLGKPQRAYWGDRDLNDSGFDDRVYFEGRVISLAARFKF